MLRYRSNIYLTLVLVSLFGVYTLYERRPRPEPVELVAPTEAACAAPLEPTLVIRVHVVGAVAAPGVYVLAPDGRIIDAVQAAGGMTAQADEEGVNLADRLADGQQIRVPLLDAAPRPTLTPMPAGASPAGGPGAVASVNPGALINLNTASAAELESLPGIGPVLAQRIIAHRQEQGPFGAIEEIIQVSGIGDAIYGRIRDLVTVQ